ncbi:MAG: tetratricopeptide repeat protein, partial [Anaerolineae bacterium]|nr:tetratricopeptide repeat protein [Anaerolineae bacterium]
VPDMTNAVKILSAAVKNQDTRLDLQINLGAALLRNEEYDRAQNVLEKARDMTEDADVLTEIDRLLLMAEDPDFEARMGELAVLVDAGVSVSADSAEFLEDVIERVPELAEAYIMLAKAYVKWGEKQDALDVLLDGQKRLPEHPDILEPLAQLLWESHEHDLAMNYLNKGLTANPKHVPLLVLAGRCLFDDGQFEAARSLLMRAESLEPRNLLLAEARAYIAKSMLD